MSLWLIAFIALYLSVLIAYFFSETSGNHRRRSVNKIVLASLYLAYAFFVALTEGLSGVHIICLAAIVFSWLGDVLLLNSFMKGGIAFAIGNALFVAYEILLAVRYGIRPMRLLWAIPLLALVWGLQHVLVMKGWLSGRHVKAFSRYFLSTAAHGCLGLALALTGGNAHIVLLGLGLFLFMVSDAFLALHKFRCPQSKAILRLNSGTYFIGLLLIVLSLSLIP